MSISDKSNTTNIKPSTAFSPTEFSMPLEMENSEKRKNYMESKTKNNGKIEERFDEEAKQRMRDLKFANLTAEQQKIVDKQEKDILDSNKDYRLKQDEEEGLYFGRGVQNTRPIKSFLDKDYMKNLQVDGKTIPWDGWDREKKLKFLKKESSSVLASGANTVFHNIFKGVSSESNHLNSGRLTNWKRYVEDLVKTQKHLSGASKKYPEILKGFVNSLGNADFDENGILNQDSMARLMKNIEDQIKVEEKHDDEEAKKLKEIVDKVSGAYSSDVVQKYTKESDDMFKFRVLQMVLLFTPLSPVSLITPLLNAMLPFLNGAGFASFIASFLSVDGPLGYLAYITDKMQLDVAAQWLMENPFGFITDTVDVVADVFSPLIVSGLPVLNGPLFALGVGVAYSFYSRLLPEYEHFTKYSEARQKSKNDIKNQIKKHYNEFAAKRGIRQHDYAKKFVEEMQNLYIQETLLDDFLCFVSGHSEEGKYEMLEVCFSDIKMPKPKDEINFVDFIKSNREICCNREKLQEFLLKPENKDFYKIVIDRFTLADEISRRKPVTAEEVSQGKVLPASEMKLQLEDLLKDPEKAKKEISDNHKKRANESLFELFPACGIELVDHYHKKDPENLKKEIIQRIEDTIKYAPINPEAYKPNVVPQEPKAAKNQTKQSATDQTI